MKFKSGSRLIWKHNGRPAYQKVGDEDCDWWVSLDSSFLVEKVIDNEKVYELHSESEKPLFNKEGRLNRFGFKWPDNQVYEHYKRMANFE